MTNTIDNIYIDNDCKHGDVVQYRVRAVADDGLCSSWSLPVQIQVGDLTPPPDPILLSVSSGYAGCLLQWVFPDDPTYSHTEIFRQTVKSGESSYYDGVIVSSITSSDYRLVDTKRAEECFVCGDVDSYYCFKIRHVDYSNNKSNFSNIICQTTRGIKPNDIDKTPNEPRIYYTPTPGEVPAGDVYIAKTDTDARIWDGGTLDKYVEFVKSITDGLKLDVLSAHDKIASVNKDIDVFKYNTQNVFGEIKTKIDENDKITKANINDLIASDAKLAQDVHDNFINDDINKKLLTTTNEVLKSQGLDIETSKKILSDVNKALSNNYDKDATRDNLLSALKTAIDANSNSDQITKDETKAAIDQLNNNLTASNNDLTLQNDNFKEALNTLKKASDANANATEELRSVTDNLSKAIVNNELGDGERQRIISNALDTLSKLKLKDEEHDALLKASKEAEEAIKANLNELNNNKNLTNEQIAQLKNDNEQLKQAQNAANKAISDNTLSGNNNAEVVKALTPIVEDLKTKAIAQERTNQENQNYLNELSQQAEQLQQNINSGKSTNAAMLDDLKAKIVSLENSNANINANAANLSQQLEAFQQAQNAAQNSIKQELEIIRRYNYDLDKKIQDYINSNENWKAASDMNLQAKVDNTTLSNTLRNYLNKSETEQFFNMMMDRTYSPILTQAGINAENAKEKAEFLLNNVGTPAMIDFSKWIGANPSWQNDFDKINKTATEVQALKTSVENLARQSTEIQNAMNQVINDNSALSSVVTNMGLQDSDTIRKLGAVIQNDQANNEYFLAKTQEQMSKIDAMNQSLSSLIQNDQANNEYFLAKTNTHDSMLNYIANNVDTLASKVSRAITKININSSGGTLGGNISYSDNLSGGKTVTIDHDVNSQGLVNKLKGNFVIKNNNPILSGYVEENVYGEVVSQ